MRILEKLKELQVHIASLDVKEADTDPDVFWDYMNSRREYKDLLVNNLPALLEVVEAVDKMLPEIDDFLFCCDDDRAIWTSYMSRLGDLLDKLEANHEHS